ncbi:tyrosine-type recombinase/integrase [Sphingobium sp. WCS2017Hpa-17]|uniref:tyrosine-type recombinase/integrase n=1 Tax=Sphingobium sp. WCS2017Hpa-17 TaxID=3073638 RepID=UPI00288B2E41|nr:tyrosine-type recombinase/integrase [Sphingobium sp. WCS2017Hpa-17]
MPVEKLTAQFCQLAYCEPGKKRTDYYDTEIKGLILSCHASGSKSFSLRFTDEYGKQKEMKLASYGDAPLGEVRKKAQQLRSEIVLGGNPATKKAEKKSVATYAALADQHLDYAKSYQKHPANTERILRLHLIPRWGKLRLDEITQPAVAKWFAEKASEGLAPATVEKVRVTLNRSFELAIRWDMSGVTKNPVKGIPRKPIENKRERYVSAAEAKRLLAACETSLNPQLKHIVGMLLLTGARVSELLHAEWRHIDLEKRQWLIPTSKTGRARHVPLSQPAIAILKAVPRLKDCSYVLPNPETRKPFVTIKHAWQTARKEAVLPDLRIHDLRHSAASFMINAGIDLFAVGRVLGHADHKSTMRYSHLANDTLLAAVEAGAKKMKGSPTLR